MKQCSLFGTTTCVFFKSIFSFEMVHQNVVFSIQDEWFLEVRGVSVCFC